MRSVMSTVLLLLGTLDVVVDFTWNTWTQGIAAVGLYNVSFCSFWENSWAVWKCDFEDDAIRAVGVTVIVHAWVIVYCRTREKRPPLHHQYTCSNARNRANPGAPKFAALNSFAMASIRTSYVETCGNRRNFSAKDHRHKGSVFWIVDWVRNLGLSRSLRTSRRALSLPHPLARKDHGR